MPYGQTDGKRCNIITTVKRLKTGKLHISSGGRYP